jgi:hypothetical protein
MAQPAFTLRQALIEIMDIAIRADEAGLTVLSNILLLVVRAAKEAPSTRKCLVNGAYCLMEAIDSVHRDRRRAHPRALLPKH